MIPCYVPPSVELLGPKTIGRDLVPTLGDWKKFRGPKF